MVCVLNCNPIRVLAADNQDEEFSDYYDMNYTETIYLDGVNYQLTYSYDNEGNQHINIRDLETLTTEVITYDAGSNALYYNNQNIMSYVSDNTENPAFITPYDANWLYFSSGSRVISHLETMTAMAFVAAIAAYISPYSTAVGVLAAIGATSVDYIIGQFAQATVNVTVYKFNSNLVTQFRYDWSVTPSGGSTYGPYTSVSPII